MNKEQKDYFRKVFELGSDEDAETLHLLLENQSSCLKLMDQQSRNLIQNIVIVFAARAWKRMREGHKNVMRMPVDTFDYEGSRYPVIAEIQSVVISQETSDIIKSYSRGEQVAYSTLDDEASIIELLEKDYLSMFEEHYKDYNIAWYVPISGITEIFNPHDDVANYRIETRFGKWKKEKND